GRKRASRSTSRSRVNAAPISGRTSACSAGTPGTAASGSAPPPASTAGRTWCSRRARGPGRWCRAQRRRRRRGGRGVLWTRPLRPERFQVGVFPVFYLTIAGAPFYGFPDHDDTGFKIGRYHHRGERVDPDTMDRTCDAEDERVLREGIRRFFPDADGP